jgi:hypothetical protein
MRRIGMPAKIRVTLALLGATVLLVHMAILTVWVAQLQLHDRITIGMTSEDVAKRLGSPQRITRAGEALDPPHVSGFTPALENHNMVHTYYWRFEFVYVFFDKDNRVEAYYVCRP